MPIWSILKGSLVLTLVAGAACTSSTEAAELEALARGAYELRWVNGEAPPYPLGEQEGFFVEVLEGHITLNPDLSCEFGHSFRLVSLEDSTIRTDVENEACTWTITPAGVHLRFPTGYISGVFSRDALYFSYNFLFPASFVYERGPPR